MRVLHLLAPSAVGGLERVVQLLAIAQRDAGLDAEVVAVGGYADAAALDGFAAPLRMAGVPVERWRLPSTRAYMAERALLRDRIRVIQPAIVHTHGYRSDVLGGMAARAVGCRAVSTVHGFTGGGIVNRTYEAVQRRVLRRSAAVVAVAAPIVDRLRGAGVGAHRVHLVPNAWRRTLPALERTAARRALAIGDDTFAIGWVGRVSAEKGLDVLVDALSHLGTACGHLHILGDGAERASVVARARAAGVGARTVWHGLVENAERWFAAFDVFVLSSHSEGTPMVLFEAIDAEVPIVATRVGGVPHVVGPSGALLVPPGDATALAAAIQAVRDDGAAARARATAARQRLTAEFGVDAWVERYRHVYQQALHRH